MDLMIETPQSIIDHTGKVTVNALCERRGPRRAAPTGLRLHAWSHHRHTSPHPPASIARHSCRSAWPARAVNISDGARRSCDRAAPGDQREPLTPSKRRKTCRGALAWKLTMTSPAPAAPRLLPGWAQPFQLPVRYAAVYTLLLESLDDASRTAEPFRRRRGPATLRATFDDAATARACSTSTCAASLAARITEDEACHGHHAGGTAWAVVYQDRAEPGV